MKYHDGVSRLEIFVLPHVLRLYMWFIICSRRGRPPSVTSLKNNKRGTIVHHMSTRKKSVPSSSSKKKRACDTEQQEGNKNNETESELQSESSTSTSLPLSVGAVPQSKLRSESIICLILYIENRPNNLMYL
jgi:hypothetical protein